MAKSVAPSQTLAPVDVMIGWLGTKEVPGPHANPIIAGRPTSWFALIGHPEIKSDEVANCATGFGAAEVVAALLAAGLTLDDVAAAAEEKPPRSALQLLADNGVNVVLPPLDQRMLARSYCTWGIDARNDPKRGDAFIIARGAKWQGHIMRIVSVNRQTGVAKCIGANQSDTTSYAEHHLSEAIAIRRGVPATLKDLRKAGSTTVAKADQQQVVGGGLVIGGIGTAVAETVTQSATHQVAQPVADAALNLPQMADQTTIAHTLISTGVAIGNIFIENPWLIICLGAGAGVWWLGRSGKLNRLAQHIAGVPLSSQTA